MLVRFYEYISDMPRRHKLIENSMVLWCLPSSHPLFCNVPGDLVLRVVFYCVHGNWALWVCIFFFFGLASGELEHHSGKRSKGPCLQRNAHLGPLDTSLA